MISFCACTGAASVISLIFVQVFVGENTNLFKVLFQPDLFVCYSIRDKKHKCDNKVAVVGTHNKILRCRSEHLPAYDVNLLVM